MVGDFVEPKDLGEALSLYRSLLAEVPSEELIADFMVFCWQAIDPGYVAAVDLDIQLFHACADQLQELAASAGTTCGPWSAPMFWKRYIEWADLGEDLSIEDCKLFMQHSPGYIEPAFYMFMGSENREMRAEAMSLLAQSSPAKNSRAKHVKSVLESALTSERGFR